ncbi:hypothetical protein IEQ34_018216 [Dendrobium chrysotoxum]|uniref:Uncharacterized protein n=1 Tax=Dendrobium chrysotoxum TaxID=161865 RepID=A0AAV7GDM1_DENCH|nr:hypothetical protein IEQ34_018216 [Dendrobium chrysotoxum]
MKKLYFDKGAAKKSLSSFLDDGEIFLEAERMIKKPKSMNESLPEGIITWLITPVGIFQKPKPLNKIPYPLDSQHSECPHLNHKATKNLDHSCVHELEGGLRLMGFNGVLVDLDFLASALEHVLISLIGPSLV